jgi:hypothetical protein
MRALLCAAAASGLLVTGACTESRTAEKHAGIGAVAGAATGAVVGEVVAGKPGVGAGIGAVAGALGGAVVGCAKAEDCFKRARDSGDRRYDSRADRYYYVDPETGDTYWENGQFRSYGPGRP